MTHPQLAFGAAGSDIAKLRVQLEQVLAEADADVTDLIERLQKAQPHDLICVAFVGQYNAGKSSLLRCLTGRDDIDVGADVVTRRTRSYEWNGHLLVDTPGVRAGVDAMHDAESAAALQAADVVVFVITPEGFDDTTADYFTWIRQQLLTLSQLVVVINKALSEDSDPAAVEEGLRAVLGDVLDVVPVVWTDADSWLRADTYPLPGKRRTASNVPHLSTTLERVLRDRGAQLRLGTPLRLVFDTAGEALQRLAGSTALSELREQLDHAEQALDLQRQQLDASARRRAEEARSTLYRQIVQAGPELSEQELTALVSGARAAYDRGFDEDGEEVNRALMLALDPAPSEDGGSSRRTINPPAVPDNRPLFDWKDVRRPLQQGLRRLADEFAGEGARPGGVGNTVVKRVWHGLGQKFRPWGAVKASRNVAATARVLGPALTVGETAWGVYSVHRAQQQAQRAAQDARNWQVKSVELSESIVAPWLAETLGGVDQYSLVQRSHLARQRLRVNEQLRATSDVAAALLDVQREATSQLERLADVRPDGGTVSPPSASPGLRAY